MPEHKMVTVNGVRYRLEDAPEGSGAARPSHQAVDGPAPADSPASGRPAKPVGTSTAAGKRKRATGDADGV